MDSVPAFLFYHEIAISSIVQLHPVSRNIAVSFLFQNGMYHHSIPITLSSVKYLGLGKVALQTILRYFQNEDEYYLSKNTIPQLVLGLDGVDMCTVKKMFIILLVLDQLGITESVSVLAQYLYYGSVWEDKNGSAYR